MNALTSAAPVAIHRHKHFYDKARIYLASSAKADTLPPLMDTKPLDTQHLEGTIKDLDRVIESLHAQKIEIDARIEETQKRRVYWEKLLRNIGGDGVVNTVKRAPRGQAKKTILAHMAAEPARVFTIKEMADETTIPWSSVRNVLEKAVDNLEIVRKGEGFVIAPPQPAMKFGS